MSLARLFITTLVICSSKFCEVQANSTLQRTKYFPGKSISKVSVNVDDVEKKLSDQTLSLLKKTFQDKNENYLFDSKRLKFTLKFSTYVIS